MHVCYYLCQIASIERELGRMTILWDPRQQNFTGTPFGEKKEKSIDDQIVYNPSQQRLASHAHVLPDLKLVKW